MQWIKPPEGAEEVSLWHCLHDGKALSISSDLAAQTVTLAVNVGHLVGGDFPDELDFLVTLDGVRSVQAMRYILPFEFQEPAEEVTRVERSRLIHQYHETYRAESMDWKAFEASLAVEPLDISDAALFLADGVAMFVLGGSHEDEQYDDIYCEVCLSGSALRVTRSDGQPFSLEELIARGDRYWEAFSERARAHAPSSPSGQAA